MHQTRILARTSMLVLTAVAFIHQPLGAQERSAGSANASIAESTPRRPLVDRYYAAYANMSRDVGQHMNAWLAFYDDSIFLEDPTYHAAITGRDAIGKSFTDAFRAGEWGPLEFRIDRWAQSGKWVAVEGVVSGLRKGKPVVSRFSTWLRFKGDRIVHQIDYVDYAGIDRQLKGAAPIAPLPAYTVPAKVTMTTAAMTRTLGEFYRVFEDIPRDPAAGVDRLFRFFADSVRMEDPTHDLRIIGRADYRKRFEMDLSAPWGVGRWVVTRQVAAGEWAAVEGMFTGTLNERTFAARFTTWFQLRDGRITHQIDYFDYPTFLKQVSERVSPQ